MQHLVVLAGSGCSIDAGGPSMGDLWQAVVEEAPTEATKKVAEKVKYELSQGNIEEFLSKIEAYLYIHDDADVATFLDDCKRIVLEKCSGFPSRDRLGSYGTFLHRLSKRRQRDRRLKIFTTNYDLCFEKAASGIGTVVLDGFSFGSPRRYDPRYFAYDIVRRTADGDGLGNFLEGVFLLYTGISILSIPTRVG